MDVGVALKGQHEGFLCWIFLYLDYFNTNILAVILWYHCARCYHWEKLGKAPPESLYYFLKLCESAVVSKLKA